jgi:hypothetical protein
LLTHREQVGWERRIPWRVISLQHIGDPHEKPVSVPSNDVDSDRVVQRLGRPNRAATA